MGLFSGGGFLGQIGGVLGINTTSQQQTIKQAGQTEARSRALGIKDIQRQLQTGAKQFDPFKGAGLQGLAGLRQGSTIEGFGQNISDIFQGGALDPLIAERQRASDATFAQAGLTRSGGAGIAAAEIPADLAFQIESLLSGRQSELAGLGFNAATNIAGLRESAGANIANLRSGIGASLSSGLLGAEQARQGGFSNLRGLIGIGQGGLGGGEGGGEGGGGVSGGDLASLAALLGSLSDIRLKTNLNPIGRIADLTVYEWEWVAGMPEDLALMNVGFIAQDVKEKYPEFSGVECGFLTIHYEQLLEHLEGETWLH